MNLNSGAKIRRFWTESKLMAGFCLRLLRQEGHFATKGCRNVRSVVKNLFCSVRLGYSVMLDSPRGRRARWPLNRLCTKGRRHLLDGA